MVLSATAASQQCMAWRPGATAASPVLGLKVPALQHVDAHASGRPVWGRHLLPVSGGELVDQQGPLGIGDGIDPVCASTAASDFLIRVMQSLPSALFVIGQGGGGREESGWCNAQTTKPLNLSVLLIRVMHSLASALFVIRPGIEGRQD